jgi:uncharacterized membrane protein
MAKDGSRIRKSNPTSKPPTGVATARVTSTVRRAPELERLQVFIGRWITEGETVTLRKVDQTWRHGVASVPAIGVGHVLFACGLAGLGVLSLISADFALSWQPVPAWVPWRQLLALVSGAVLLAGGLGLLVKGSAAPSALLLTIDVAMWLLLLHAPRVAAHPSNVGVWLGLSENLVLVVGGWILLFSLTATERRANAKIFATDQSVRVARFLYAAALPVIGLSHFVYVEATTALVPTWLPNRVGLAYLTGAAHMAAGVGLLLAVVPRLAATLEAMMISLFTLLVWVPRVAAVPASRPDWTALFVSSALAGAAWIVANSLPDLPWRALGRPRRP